MAMVATALDTHLFWITSRAAGSLARHDGRRDRGRGVPRRAAALGAAAAGPGAGPRPPARRSGGLAKGLFADVLAEMLAGHETFAADCAGDVRVGGAAGTPRRVLVASPFGGAVLHRWDIAAGAAATSGIGRRSWIDAHGRVAHHLLDPSSGRPAYTGIVRATALAPTAVQAEERAKLALLRAPAGAADALPDGGLLVYDDASHEVIAPRSSSGSVTIPACAASSSPLPSSR